MAQKSIEALALTLALASVMVLISTWFFGVTFDCIGLGLGLVLGTLFEVLYVQGGGAAPGEVGPAAGSCSPGGLSLLLRSCQIHFRSPSRLKKCLLFKSEVGPPAIFSK
jgi:hypothetical protein